MADLKYGELWTTGDVRALVVEQLREQHPKSKVATLEKQADELMLKASQRTFDPTEPQFVLRAKDSAWWDTIKAYERSAEERGSPIEHLTASLNSAAAGANWQQANPGLVTVAD